MPSSRSRNSGPVAGRKRFPPSPDPTVISWHMVKRKKIIGTFWINDQKTKTKWTRFVTETPKRSAVPAFLLQKIQNYILTDPEVH